jgi:predicted DCC family thiol-disulfide oxidoreductase YuxK
VARPVVLYDGACRLCRACARAIARLDRRQRLALLPFDEPEADALLAPLPTEERRASWRLLEPDGRLLGEAAAGVSLLEHLEWPHAARLARRTERLLDRLYGFTAKRRGSLGRVVPDGAAPRRYP